MTWSLRQERTTFLEVAIATILLDNMRHRDRSGMLLLTNPSRR